MDDLEKEIIGGFSVDDDEDDVGEEVPLNEEPSKESIDVQLHPLHDDFLHPQPGFKCWSSLVHPAREFLRRCAPVWRLPAARNPRHSKTFCRHSSHTACRSRLKLKGQPGVVVVKPALLDIVEKLGMVKRCQQLLDHKNDPADSSREERS